VRERFMVMLLGEGRVSERKRPSIGHNMEGEVGWTEVGGGTGVGRTPPAGTGVLEPSPGPV